MLGLNDQALKPGNKLSGEQQQYVAIARVFIKDPIVIMGDEPTGNLDSKNTSIVFDIFRQLTKKMAQTLITLTQDEDFAANCDRVKELSDGNLVIS